MAHDRDPPEAVRASHRLPRVDPWIAPVSNFFYLISIVSNCCKLAKILEKNLQLGFG
jgi:hypothetical protein